MPNKKKLDTTYMEIAKTVANLSYCWRSKVGAVIVKDNNILSFGYNGTPGGMDNCCEDTKGLELVTKWTVLHAESNAITKVARSTMSSQGATLYCTLSPCDECSKLIIQAGISRVVYLEEYKKSTKGLKLMQDAGLKVKQLKHDRITII